MIEVDSVEQETRAVYYLKERMYVAPFEDDLDEVMPGQVPVTAFVVVIESDGEIDLKGRNARGRDFYLTDAEDERVLDALGIAFRVKAAGDGDGVTLYVVDQAR